MTATADERDRVLPQVTFNWPGFLAAMGSNVTFQSRNVLSKKFMGDAGKVR